MENMVRLIEHTLFVAGVDNPGDAEQILAAISNETPVGCMFREKGHFILRIAEGESLIVPFRKIRLDDPAVLIRSMKYVEGGVEFTGIGIGLPDDAARLQAAYEATLSGMPYDWDTFLFSYQMDLEKIAGILITNLDAARTDGLQAQVITDPRVGPNQVGMNRTTARLFMKRLAKRHPELEMVEDLDGMWVLLQRYPVVSSTGGRWVQIVILDGRPSNKLFVNPTTWKELHDGDEDGDSGYISVGTTCQFGDVEPVGEYPQIVMVDGSSPLPGLVEDWKEAQADYNPVQTAMNFLAKQATGPITHMFTCIARTNATRSAMAVMDEVDESMKRYRRALCGVYDLFRPMMEAVMDSRKEKNGLLKFMSVVEQLESAIAGTGFIVDPFLQFVPEDKQQTLAAVFVGCNHTLSLTRRTAYGRVIASGSQLSNSVGRLIDAMLEASIPADQIIDRLEMDATGENLCLLPVKAPGKPKVGRTPITFELGEVADVKSIFTAITYMDRPVFHVVGLRTNEDGTTNVKLRIDPVWKKGDRKTHLVEVTLPKITKVGEDGHCLLYLDGLAAERIFKPVFRLVDGNLDKMVVRHWLAAVMKEAGESVARRKAKTLKDEKVQDILNKRLAKAVRELTGVDKEGKELLIRRAEYEVLVPKSGSIRGDWAEYEVLLTFLNDLGYDVVTTSKNKPGTVVTKAGKYGMPTFLLAMNPFARYLDPKRRVEAREIRKSLELFHPIACPLKVDGLKLPEQLAKCVTMLNVMVADFPGLNTFTLSTGETDCFDTILCTESAVEKLAIARLVFKEERMDLIRNHMSRLMDMGLGIDAMEVTTTEESLGDGLWHQMHTLTVECKITDVGKIKACVGPVKGVMNVMPHRLFAVNPDGTRTEIDVVVPRTTAEKKKAIDMLLYMGYAKAGLENIDPTKSLDEHVVEMQSALAAKGYAVDGTQTIVAVYEDGTEAELGTAVVGPLPFFRPTQTGLSTFDIRTGKNGIKVHAHTLVMAQRTVELEDGRNFTLNRVKFEIPAWVKEDFAQVVECRSEVVGMVKEAQESGTPGHDYAPAFGDGDASADIYDYVG